MTEPKPTPNRRRAPRRKPKKSSRVFCYSGRYGLGPNVAVTLLDVSETGVRLVLKVPLAVGDEVEIGLDGIGERRPSKAAAQVVWCIPLADGNHCIGARFDKPLRWMLLQGLTCLWPEAGQGV